MAGMLKFIIACSIACFFSTAYAQTTGQYVTIDEISVGDDVLIETGTTLYVLGIIDVPSSITASGQLATFSYQGRIYNSDASMLMEVIDDASMRLLPPNIQDNGNSVSICSTLTSTVNNSNVDLKSIDLTQFLEVQESGVKVETYSIKKPKFFMSDYRSETDFCVTGLKHSSDYRITVLKGLTTDLRIVLDKNLVMAAKTPAMPPSILVDGSKNILPVRNSAVIPVTTTNIKDLELSVYRVDLASLPSYSQIFEVLDDYDVDRLQSSWAESIGSQKLTVSGELNKASKINVNLSGLLKDVEPGLFVAVFRSDQLNLRRWQNLPIQWFMVSDIALQLFSGKNKTDIFLSSFEDTKAIAGADLEIFAANNKKLFSGKSDQSGRVTISNDLLKGQGGFAPEIVLARALDGGVSIVEVGSLSSKPRIVSGGISKLHSEDVYLTTDRNIFRQSDEINVFGVVRTLDLQVIKDKELKLLLRDSRGDVHFSELIQTNEFGVFTSKIKLNQNFPLDRYSLDVERMDEDLIAQHEILIDDFVPLTIEPKLSVVSEVWTKSGKNSVLLAAEYFSGGPAGGLDGEIAVDVRAVNRHQNPNFKDYIFGDFEGLRSVDNQRLKEELTLSGDLAFDFSLDFEPEDNHLYEAKIEGIVFDVGGRPNKTTLTVPIDTHPSYVGILSEFGDRIDEGLIPSFDIVNLNILGEKIPLEDISYTVKKIDYDYNWYYDEGWNYRRIRLGDEVVETGVINRGQLTLKSPLQWGLYDISAKTGSGFETTLEFYVGWGNDGKSTAQPEELNLYYDPLGKLKFDAPFSGKAKVIIADSDLQQIADLDVKKGAVELPLVVTSQVEPGSHILVTLVRPIEEGTEHLPQIAMGKTWVEFVSESRNLSLTIDTKNKVQSIDEIEVNLTLDQQSGSAMIFLVDDGIHAVTGYKNENIRDHFLSEREITLGVMSNLGKLISQDYSLPTIKVGGGGSEDTSKSIGKSDFFNTVTAASPLLKIEDGKASYVFKQSDFEGRLRLVAFAVTQTGFVNQETDIIVQDPVSLDVSLPRFLTPADFVTTKLQIRRNNFEGPITLSSYVDGVVKKTEFPATDLTVHTSVLELKAGRLGRIPVVLELDYGINKITRSFEIVSRNSAYPATELFSFPVQKTTWPFGKPTKILPIQTKVVDLNVAESNFKVALSRTSGVNIAQAVAGLNRYYYGCIEQVSSGARGLIAFGSIMGMDVSTKAKLDETVNRIIDKQMRSGAFGYWGSYSTIYPEYQPYAIDTLQKALPYVSDPLRVSSAIEAGLKYLYTRDFDYLNDKLYSYGILAQSGYEVTSRLRYTIDNEINIDSVAFTDAKKVYENHFNMNRLSLAYWAAAKIQDKKRTQYLQSLISTATTVGLVAPQYGALLADIPDEYRTPLINEVIAQSERYLSQKSYRSTFDNAQLVQLNSVLKASTGGIKIKVDGINVTLDKSGIIPLTKKQLVSGFEISQSEAPTMYVSSELFGSRNGMIPIDNGYKVTKEWYDTKGAIIDMSNGVLEANQGDLFTVVVTIEKSGLESFGDLLLTDLLPSGFEIEKASMSPPKFNGQAIDFDDGPQPDHIEFMDDRFVAHYEQRWRGKQQAKLSYVVRAAYQTEAQIADAHVEHMYAPEISGRSYIAHVTTTSK